MEISRSRGKERLRWEVGEQSCEGGRANERRKKKGEEKRERGRERERERKVRHSKTKEKG